MKTLKTLLGTAVATVGAIALTGQQAAAFDMLENGTAFTLFLECLNDGVGLVVDSDKADAYGWQYAIDSFNDGTHVGGVGGDYEIYGMAVLETESEIWVTVNANTPLLGHYFNGAADKNVGWGDLFVDLDGTNFENASNNGDLFGVRFAGTNDSGVGDTGVYSGIGTESVASDNSGFSSLSSHDNLVENSYGGTASLGDLNVDPNNIYYGEHLNDNVIAYGQREGGITYRTEQELASMGYNGSQFSGSDTIAFSFNKSSIGLNNPSEEVPEPFSMAALGAVGIGLMKRKMRKRAVAK